MDAKDCFYSSFLASNTIKSEERYYASVTSFESYRSFFSTRYCTQTGEGSNNRQGSVLSIALIACLILFVSN